MKKIILILLSIISLLSPSVLFAQYLPLVGLPGYTGGSPDFDTYIETIYAVTITVAALLAVIKIVIAGVKWMTTDIVTSKGDAKKDIQGAVIGLLVVLSAVLVIEIINPNINDVDISIATQSPPAPVIPTEAEAANAICASYSGGCIIQDCGRPTSAITCEQATTDCLAEPTYTAVRMTGPNTLVCQIVNDPAIVQIQAQIGQTVIDQIIADEGLTNLVTQYDLSSIPLSDRQNYVDNIWPDQCELDASGNPNGNTFIVGENVNAGVAVHICAN